MILTVARTVTKRCPYADEVDTGSLSLSFDVADGLDGPELHELAAKLDTLLTDCADVAISHEAFTRRMLAETGAVKAQSWWTTAGLSVTCSTSAE